MSDEVKVEITEHQLRAARRISQWELGSAWWADMIIDALRNPTHTINYVKEQKDA